VKEEKNPKGPKADLGEGPMLGM